jgi:hypothetical protein
LLFYDLLFTVDRVHRDTGPYVFPKHDCTRICDSTVKVIAALTDRELPIYPHQSSALKRATRCCPTSGTKSLSDDCLREIVCKTLKDIRSFKNQVSYVSQASFRFSQTLLVLDRNLSSHITRDINTTDI